MKYASKCFYKLTTLLSITVFFTAVMPAFSKPDSTLTLCGKIADWQEVGEEGLSLVIFKNYRSETDAIQGERYQLSLDRDSFHLVINLVNMSPVFYGRFDGLFKRGAHAMIGFPFMFHAGDSLHIRRDNLGVVRAGRENELMQCQLALLSDANMTSGALAYSLANGDRHRYYLSGMAAMRQRVDSVMRAYSPSLTPFQSELIRVNFLSYMDTMAWQQMAMMTLMNRIDREYLPQLLDEMTGCHQQLTTPVPDSIYTLSNTFLDAKVKYYWAKAVTFCALEDRPDDWFKELYRFIKSENSGHLRDRILLAAIHLRGITFQDNATIIYHLEDALTFVSDAQVKAGIFSLLGKFKEGTPVPHFEFYAMDGTKRELKDFRSKVIVAHFWFLGCVPCKEMSKNLTPIFEEFGNSEDIVFLNINVDKKKENWVKGVDEGAYSHDQEVLLSTGPSGFNHPIISYYHYYGMPQLMIIDRDGLLVTQNAPRARNDKEFTALRSVLLSALGQEGR